ncbi:DUF6746 family protein [Bowmanella pacifica]|uniref:Soluble cytochrome b562 n=1 Tax=Bowmanella pacifica TaxID=502051 RepID=A0A918DJT0_9ALTE|nr:DUF6746 family protein [Bowmanella pacifica]GGO70634.1 hypothetical protein GCM10010982_24610 [Bowmanella pacifica]
MCNKWLKQGLCAVLMVSATSALADARPDHYQGQQADSLEQAMTNLVSYNAKLKTVLAKSSLSLEDMAHIHELTYSLENALQRLDVELDSLAATLEEVHIGSEKAQSEQVKSQGQKYLKHAETLLQSGR